MNIIILDAHENVLKHLNPEHITTKITKAEDQLSQLELTYYPFDEEDYLESEQLFRIGHKVFIKIFPREYDEESEKVPNNYLFVMNTSIKREYYEKNSISVVCEDVLTELNNTGPVLQNNASGIYKITVENMNKWFRPYTCEDKTKLHHERDSIRFKGSINRMNLLRLVEETTRCKFIPVYENLPNNKLKKKLILQKASKIGVKHIHPLELGFNASQLHFEIDETEQFNAMSPIFNANQDSNTVVDYHEIAKAWRNLEIKKGSHVAYLYEIIEKKIIPITQKTHFYKEKGKSYISSPYSDLDYDHIFDTETQEKLTKKVGNFEVTKEYDKSKLTIKQYLENIYCDCEKALEKKLNQKVKLEVGGIKNVGKDYDLYDKVKIKVPHIKKVLKAYVSQVEFDPFNPTDARINLETEDFEKHYRETTTLNFKNEDNKNIYVNLRAGETYLAKKVRYVMVKESRTISVTRKKRNVNYKNGRGDKTITFTAKPSCSWCKRHKVPYKWFTTTFVNRCPLCGHAGTLHNAHKRGAGSEREITCSHCDADYCGVCGRDKATHSRAKLLKAGKKGKGSKKKWIKYKVKKVLKGYKKTKKLRTRKTGDAHVKLGKLKPGKYHFIAFFEGDEEYLPAKNEFKINIEPKKKKKTKKKRKRRRKKQ